MNPPNDLRSAFARDEIAIEVITVHPEHAKALLSLSRGNRKLREGHVRSLAQAIARGEWRLTHQGIAFDRNGTLRDGHHRLTAIAQAGVPVLITSTVGLSEDACRAFDQGIQRSVGDILNLPQRVSQPLHAGARLVYGNGRATIPQIEAVARTGLLDELQALVDYCGTSTPAFSSAHVKLAAAVSVMQGQPRDFVFAQYRALVLADYDAMTPHSLAWARKTARGYRRTDRDTLARAMRVFDYRLRNATRGSETETNRLIESVRTTITPAGEAPSAAAGQVLARPVAQAELPLEPTAA